ncbi:MAG: carbohydrate ABC transporter permease [Arachnia propionica]|uniref:carbohydrate ABC transporter permease n=1 Tax=Arachnia propionica TaxID=1750 RepID=UPI002706A0F1|nr:carbohydrate ABC transporter permease [Arachnia propionica]
MAARDRRPLWMGRPGRLVNAAKAVVLTVLVVVMLYPFVHVIAWSFGSAEAATSGKPWPSSFSLETYEALLRGGVVRNALLVTALITVVGTLCSMLFTTTLAYGLSRTREVPFSKGALVYVLATMLFSAGMIPNYLLVKQLGMLDSWASLIVPGLIDAFNMIVIRNFFMELPGELTESARIDGASDWQIFWRIVLPLSKPILAVISLFYAVRYWNTFFNAMLYITTPSKWPIQVVLNQYVVRGQTLNTVQPPGVPPPPGMVVQFAVIVLATLPVLVVYPFVQKFFTKGMLTGAIKG